MTAAVAEHDTYITHSGLIGARSLCTDGLYGVFVTSGTGYLSVYGAASGDQPIVTSANGFLSQINLGDKKINGCVYSGGTVWVVSPTAIYKIAVSGISLTLTATFTKAVGYTDSVFVSGTSVICAGPAGTGLYAYDTTTGAETGRAPFLAVIGAICQVSSTIYVFDKYAGKFSTVTCASGVLTKTAETVLGNARNVTSARVDGSVLAVTCSAKHTLYTYNFTVPAAPVLSYAYVLLDKFPTGAFPSSATSGYYVSTMLYYNQAQTLAQGAEQGAMADVYGRVILYPGPGRLAFSLKTQVWALISQTDHSGAGVTVDPAGLIASMSAGHCRLDSANASGKRQIECVNGGGAAQIVVCLCDPTSSIDAVINSANHYTYDGTGVLSVPPGWGTGVAGIGAGDVISFCADLDAHTANVYKNGVLLGGWTGIPAGSWTVLFGSTTNIATAGLTIRSNPALFVYPVAGYTGFGSVV